MCQKAEDNRDVDKEQNGNDDILCTFASIGITIDDLNDPILGFVKNVAKC